MSYFSIIIPSFNRAYIIERAIEAVLGQSFQDWELLIVDDGSTDNTQSIIEPYLIDQRIKYLYQKNKGVCSARNKGALNARGSYLIFLDSDDFVENNWLEDFYILKDQKFDIIFCSMKMVKIDNSIRLVSCSDPYNDGKSKGIIIPGSWIVTKDIFISSGMYDEKIKYGENTELRLRFNEEQLNVGIIDKYNFIYNESLDGGSKNLQNKIESNLCVLEKHKDYFKMNKSDKINYLNTTAVASMRNGDYKLGHKFFRESFFNNPFNLKAFVRFLFSLSSNIGKYFWKNVDDEKN
jgi:glycosyltransferase involved in cell wall biosynthesis